ncbi:hypothetical protein N665_0213s0004 [Sinapis alba]|nr:hypothetical protein N665_0213s0004 [Sinapis alba]
MAVDLKKQLTCHRARRRTYITKSSVRKRRKSVMLKEEEVS